MVKITVYVLIPHADYCLPGKTRATVMELVAKDNFILGERRISLFEFHTADEVLSGMDNKNYGRTKPGMYRLSLCKTLVTHER
ncbi:unnamed protein product [Arabidopsis halleri]